MGRMVYDTCHFQNGGGARMRSGGIEDYTSKRREGIG
jgi:hypothetical protein